MKKKYRHLSFEERFAIEVMYSERNRDSLHCRVFGRSPMLVSREIQKHSVNGEYDAKKAKQKSLAERWRAKEQCLKRAMMVFFAFLSKKNWKEVVSKTNQVDI